MVGGTLHHGRESIVRACDAATVYLRTQRTTFTKFEVLCGPDFAVVDSMAAYVDGDNLRSTVASCDIYRFREQSVREIVSFTVELPPA